MITFMPWINNSVENEFGRWVRGDWFLTELFLKTGYLPLSWTGPLDTCCEESACFPLIMIHRTSHNRGLRLLTTGSPFRTPELFSVALSNTTNLDLQTHPLFWGSSLYSQFSTEHFYLFMTSGYLKFNMPKIESIIL